MCVCGVCMYVYMNVSIYVYSGMYSTRVCIEFNFSSIQVIESVYEFPKFSPQI